MHRLCLQGATENVSTLPNVLSICSFLRCRSSRGETIDSDGKRSKILTWFNLEVIAAGTMAEDEEDEDEEDPPRRLYAVRMSSRRTNRDLRRFIGSKGCSRSISPKRGKCG